MENRHPWTATRVSAAALITIFVFTGFGCRPVMNARLQQPPQEQPSLWLPEDPLVAYSHGPDLNGQITIDVRSQKDTTVTVTLDGPGILDGGYQVKEADKDGVSHFKWRTNRLGHYTYKGSIEYNRSIVETFSDEFDNEF